ncbi:tetraspanin-6-like [Thamnophis elegans]|uniref:tetraspanin-6-like n=1 Tax=Thamnophis elegans TaxID=35005 RepID=UPI001377E872|nr:tetraspanin-6-like [Thamnophis elegans]
MEVASKMRAERRITWKRCIKFALWMTVLLYWVAGVVLIITGVCFQVKLHNAFLVLNEAASGVAVTITVIGALIIILSGFGAIALFSSNKAMIKLFTGLLVLLLITEILIVATAYACRLKLHQTISKDFMRILNKYDNKVQITKGVDTLQAEFQCCGVENYTDWQNTTFGLLSSSVPKSCCKVPMESCVTDLNQNIVGINQEGCLLKLKTWTERNISALGGLAVFVIVGQVTGIMLCYILLKVTNEDYDIIEQA